MEKKIKRGVLIVISAPSGTGKDALIDGVAKKADNLYRSISVTTRPIREGETDGVDYYFTDRDGFKKLIDDDQIVEYTLYCENLYGSPREPIEKNLSMGKDVILKIEVEGALNIRRMFPDCVLVFMVPPSFTELRRRLVFRGSENPDMMEKRLKKAKVEITYAKEYDYILVNDKLDVAIDDLIGIINSEKIRTFRNHDVIEKLLED